MKTRKFLVFLLMVFSVGNAMAQGSFSHDGWPTWEYDSLFYKSVANSYTEMPYRLLKPPGFTPGDTSVKYPLMIMLHGKGEGIGQWHEQTHGRNLCQLGWGGKMHLDSNSVHPGFVIFPQTFGGGWSSGSGAGDYNPDNSRAIRIVTEILDSLFRQYPIDLDRIYIHGLSGGGQGVWEMFITFPHLFAAASPHSATGNLDSSRVILYNPMWTTQGETDTNPRPENSIKMMDSLAKNGAEPIYTFNGSNQTWPNPYTTSSEPIYTFMPNTGHSAWIGLYTSPAWLRWFYHQDKKRIRVIGAPEVCENGSQPVTMGISPKFEEYEWRKDGMVMSNSDTNAITVYEVGQYQVRYKRKKYFFSGPSEWSDWSLPVDVIEVPLTNPVTITQLGPTALPGLDGSTQVRLEAPNGYDRYKWSNGSTSNSILVSNPGNYTVKVSDPNKCFSEPSEPVVVTSGVSNGAPFAPSGLTAAAIDRTTIQLEWVDESNDETGFEIYRKTSPAQTYEFAGKADENETQFIDATVGPGKSYYYVVRSINLDGYSDPSIEVTVNTLPDNILPAIPLNLQISNVGDTSAYASWDVSSDNVGLAGYIVFLNGDSLDFTNDNFYQFNGLSNQTYFSVYIVAVDLAGNYSPASATKYFATFTSGFVYQYYGGEWNNLPDFDNLDPDKTGKVANVTLAPRIANDLFAFRFTGYIQIPSTGTYTFYTRSDDGSKLYIDGTEVVDNDYLQGPTTRSGDIYLNQGVHSIVVTFFEKTGGEYLSIEWQGPGVSRQNIPDNVLNNYLGNAPQVNAPVAINANTISSSKIQVNWQDNSNDETGFEIYRSGTSNGVYVHVGTVGENVELFRDSALSASTAYYYKVKAIGLVAESSLSNTVSATTASLPTLPAAPTGLTEVNVGLTSVDIAWSDNSNNEDYFQIQYSTDNINYFGIENLPPDVEEFTVQGLNPGYPIYLKVYAGNASGLSASSNTIFVTPVASPPQQPANLAANIISPSQIQLTWTDVSADEEGYILSRTTVGSGDTIALAQLSANITSYTDAGESGETYLYTLIAFNVNGISTPETLSVSIPDAPYAPNTSSWRIIPTQVYNSKGDVDLNNALLNGDDFFQNVRKNDGETFTVAVKLPTLNNDGMFIFNVQDINALPVTADISSNSTNGVDGSWTSLPAPFMTDFKNDLQKLDIDQSYSGQWIRLVFDASGTTDIRELGLYEFPVSGKPQYFLMLGASITERAGGHSEYTSDIKSYFSGQGYDPVIFNWAISAQNSIQLSNVVKETIAKHPNAGYLLVHIGGNDVSSRRPLTYDHLYDYFYTEAFKYAFDSIFDAAEQYDMLPLVANLTYRNYPEDLNKGQPSVDNGNYQEGGSLPYNLLINKKLQDRVPELYDKTTRRGKINFYPLTLNDQTLLRSDGIHIENSRQDEIRNYWISKAFNYVYEGEFSPELIYNEIKPNLRTLSKDAVELAEATPSLENIWNARILVEQIGDASLRVPYHIRLDEIDTSASVDVPFAPSDLQGISTSPVKVELSWTDNSYSEAYFEIYRSLTPGGVFTKVGQVPVDSLSFIDSGLVSTTPYYYKVRAGNKAGYSAFSPVVTVTTAGSVEIVWAGLGVPEDWEDNVNWNTANVPTEGAFVKLTNDLLGTGYTVNLDNPVEGIQTIEVGDLQPVVFNVGGTINTIGTNGVTSFIVNDSGTVNFNKYLIVKGDLELNGVLNINADSIVFEGSFSGNGTLNISPDCKVIYKGNNVFPAEYKHLSVEGTGDIDLLDSTSVFGVLELKSGNLISNGLLDLNIDSGFLANNPGNAGKLIGDIQVSKSVDRKKYYYVSLPLSSVARADFTKNNTLINPTYIYDETSSTRTAGDHNTGWKRVTDYVTEPGYGIAAYLRKVATMSFTGEYESSSKLVNLTHTVIDNDQELDGWNLIGNPFLSDLDWDQIAAEIDTSLIDKAIYFYDGTSYTSYVDGFPSGQGLNLLAPMQAFFIHAKQPTSLTMKNPYRSNSSSALFRLDNETQSLSITAINSKGSDKTFLRFMEEATKKFDADLDAYKFINGGGLPSIYTKNGKTLYSINSVPFNHYGNIEVPLELYSSTTGEVSIVFNGVDEFDNYILKLYDGLTGTTKMVSEGESFTYSGEENFTDRFILIFESSKPYFEPVVMYRVNSGGWEVEDDKGTWKTDKQKTPSLYLDEASNSLTTGSAKWGGMNTTEAPDAIFGSNRYQRSGGTPVSYSFPVASGAYKVNLFFAEKANGGAKSLGERMFDIYLENELVYDDLDIFEEAGLDALKKEFLIEVLDGTLDLYLGSEINNPQINGIEIVLVEPYEDYLRFGDDAVSDNFVLISPNPVNSTFSGDVSELLTGECTIQVCDMQGVSVYQESTPMYNGHFNSRLPESLKPGIYLVKIITENKMYVTRVEKH